MDQGTQSALSIERKPIEQSVNEAELLDSFWVQETEYVKPDFIWEFCCHRLNWRTLAFNVGGDLQRKGREIEWVYDCATK
jgi:hypothetical protein